MAVASRPTVTAPSEPLRVIGLYAAEGTVHFDWFDYQPFN